MLALVLLARRAALSPVDIVRLASASPAGTYLGWIVAGAAFLVAIVLARVAWDVAWWAWRRRVIRKSGIRKIDRWVKRYGRARAGHMFEQRGAAAHRKMGHRVLNIGSAGHDLGADLIVWDRAGVSTVEQYKLANGHKVGNRAVQEALAAMLHYGTDRARVVTNGYFTNSAYDQARAGDAEVELYDRDATVDLLNGVPFRGLQ